MKPPGSPDARVDRRCSASPPSKVMRATGKFAAGETMKPLPPASKNSQGLSAASASVFSWYGLNGMSR